MRTLIICRRLDWRDAASFHALRLEGFRLEPRTFRFAPEDEAHLEIADVEKRLAHDHVVGAFDEASRLIGAGGLARNSGAKTYHKALLYGMYIREAFRGAGVADKVMRLLLAEAAQSVEIVTLAVMSENVRALRFYERWGFRAYGVEERAAKIGEGDYLDETLMALRLV